MAVNLPKYMKNTILQAELHIDTLVEAILRRSLNTLQNIDIYHNEGVAKIIKPKRRITTEQRPGIQELKRKAEDM